MTEKAPAKIDIKVGTISFTAEGEQSWVAEQLAKVLETAQSAGAIQGTTAESPAVQKPVAEGDFTMSLGAFIKAKSAESNQVKRFLATAAWLEKRGAVALATALVTEALTKHKQTGLRNPAQCLNQNVSKGLCEKKGKGFFITPEGWASLGEGE
jgi:dihydroorotase-like cyclic amidohydrolase